MSVNDPIIRLRHMLDAARKAVKFVEGETRDSLPQNEILSLAIIRLIEIIGEAASRIPQEIRDASPQIPWQAITGMRNRIVHAYFDVNYEIVWDTVTKGLPSLIVELERLIPSEDDRGQE